MTTQFRRDSLAKLRRRTGLLMHRDKFLYGTVLASPAPTSSTFALEDAKKYPDGHYTGQIFYVVTGTGSGQSGFVSDSAAGTGVITASPALGVTLDATSVVEIWPDEITPEAVNNALNLAQDDLEDRIKVYTETTGPTFNADRNIITIPDTYICLVGVWYIDSGGSMRVFRYRHNPDVPGQEHQRDFTITGRQIRLSEPIGTEIPDADITVAGYTLPDEMEDDDDLASCPASYLIYKAAANLEQSLTGNIDIDSEGHGTRGAQWLAQATQRRNEIPYTNVVPNTVILDIPGA